MTTLDKLIEEYGIPSFIRIDVEGYELEVLKGLSVPINMISFEYTVPEQFDRINQCIQVVKMVSPDLLCNFSKGESMTFHLEEWLPVNDFIDFINSNKFPEVGYGDIYLKANFVNNF